MSEEETPSEETPKEPTAEEPEDKPEVLEPEEDSDDIDEEPIKEKKTKPKKTSKQRAKLTVLQAAVLETVRERPQRPRAIQTIIYSAGGVEIPRNEIIRSLNELRTKGLVDKVSAKAWQAK
ncbi:MAG: hypothetical protein ACFFDJ_07760 [Candidatus Odinarchaeota archaeon]